jgi:hypothetical protein
MGLNTDLKGSAPGRLPVDSKTLQPTISNQSKAAEAGGFQQHRNIMATIVDDDDRLLVRIGYTPVSTL